MTTIKTEKRIATLETCMTEVKEDISAINSNLNNHINSLTEKVDLIKGKTDTISNDMEWIKKFFWVIATATIGSLVGAIINLIK